jgi:HD-like signal output (HDOD) protein
LHTAESQDIPLHLAEQATIGVDHTLVGAMLARRWQFPDELADCIAGHHSMVLATPLAECLYAADHIAGRLGYASAGNLAAETEAPPWPTRFGASIESLMAELGTMDIIINEAEQYASLGRAT